MRTRIDENGVSVWLSARDTSNWARKPGAAWPCSQLADKRVFAQYDRSGLCDLAITDGWRKRGDDVSSDELNAIVSDHLAGKLPKDHPCYFVVVGQFIAS